MGQVMHSRLLRITLIAGLLGASATVFTPSTAQAAISPDQFEACLLEKINDDRAEVGSPPLAMVLELNVQVRDWSRWMRNNEFQHMHPSERNPILPEDTIIWGENIARNSNSELPDCSAIHNQLMDSDGHRANLLSENFRFAALGAYGDSSGWWVTELFFDVRGCNGTFCDDDTSVFEEAIEKIAAAGITHGCNPPANDRYCPDQYVTRGAMAAFLSRALSL
jgi:uncharacterized protein YkwD